MDVVLSVGVGNAVGALVLALVAAGAGLVCRRPAVLHGLWLLVLLKLLTPPLWPVPVTWPETLAAEQESFPVLVLSDFKEPAPPAGFAAEVHADQPPATVVQPGTATDPVAGWPWKEIVLIAWAFGVLALGCLTLVRIVRFRRLLGRLAPAPAEIQQRTRDVAGRLGLARCPEVYLVSVPISPLVWALGCRARLLVPAALWQQLGHEQRDLLLAHELAHLRRGDPFVRLLELIVLVLYWWHPAAWWARRRLRETGEQCCDAWVVATFPERAVAYATTLVESAVFLSRSRVTVPAGASGMGHVPLLRRRVTMIVQGRIPRSLSWANLVLLLAAAAVLLPLWPTCAGPCPEDGTASAAPVQPAVVKPADGQGSEAQAEKDYDIASYYDRTGHPGSAYFYYEIVLRRHPGSAFADKAAQRMRELKGQANPGEEIALLQAQLKIQQAQCRLAELALKNAQERLAQQPAKEDTNRLREMEKKLEQLQKELDALRKEMKAAKSVTPPAAQPTSVDAYIIHDNRFTIPFQIAPEMRSKIACVVLYVSRDQGQTWQIHSKVAPTETGCRFEPPENGEYWFTMEVLDRDGQSMPSSLGVKGKAAMLKVTVAVPR
jgi:beta-lactamase regulating signal transducer with metallopeptidase domain